MMLRKKTHKLHTSYLASDIQADVFAWLGVQHRSCGVSKFYKVELDKEKVYAMYTRRTKYHLLQNTGCLANIAVLLCSSA